MRLPVFVCLTLLGCAAPAAAQSFFVEGGAVAAIERRGFSASSDGSLSSPNRDGVVAGGAVSVGTWLTPRVSVRLQFVVPGRVDSMEETTQGPVPTDLSGGLTVFLPTVTRRTEVSERVTTTSVLVGYHMPRRHGVELSYLGGAAFLRSSQTARYTTSYNLPPEVLALVLRPADMTTEFTSTAYGVTAEVGMDADVRLSSRWSIVPQGRLVGYGGGLSIRPTVVLRARW